MVYAAVPVTLTGDPARGVIIAAYLADEERSDADEAARLMLIVGAVTLLGAVGAAWLVAGRILRPLRDITETAQTITETDLSQRIPWRGGVGDELGDLVATVNGMLDRVETAWLPSGGSSTTRATNCARRSRSSEGTWKCSIPTTRQTSARRSPLSTTSWNG